jgi:predicted outer membrane lipoprotein
LRLSVAAVGAGAILLFYSIFFLLFVLQPLGGSLTFSSRADALFVLGINIRLIWFYFALISGLVVCIAFGVIQNIHERRAAKKATNSPHET